MLGPPQQRQARNVPNMMSRKWLVQFPMHKQDTKRCAAMAVLATGTGRQFVAQQPEAPAEAAREASQAAAVRKASTAQQQLSSSSTGYLSKLEDEVL